MSSCPCPKCKAETVFDPPVTKVENVYHPRVVNVVHQIEILRRHHCVPVPCHTYTVTVRDEFCD